MENFTVWSIKKMFELEIIAISIYSLTIMIIYDIQKKKKW
jgi:hypothetical protein